MKFFYRLSTVLLLALLFPHFAKASHVSGGDITYTCVGPNTYFITLKLFRDCSGTTMTNTATVTFSNSCGLANPSLTLYLQNPATGTNCTGTVLSCATEISQLCPAQLPNSTCGSGTLPGMQQYVYTGTVTLPGTCNNWTIAYNLCCRNTSTNISGAPSFHIETTLATASASCNNSPVFTAQPVPYVCVGQLVNYNNGVVETDGDSLSYSLVSALQATATPVTYNAGYSGAVPVPGITINSATGQVTFTPGSIGIFVVVIMVNEYRSGVLIGTVMRDIQFVVQACTNTVPASGGGTITGLTGTSVQTGPYSLEMCEGDNFSFTVTFTDTDPSDVLTLISNITTVLPGATFTVSGTNPVTATISWTAPGGSAGGSTGFFITVNDGACPIPGTQTMIYTVNILQGTYAGPDAYYCPSGSPVPLSVTGGSAFTWTPATGLSCTSCSNPTASPAVTTTYIVTSDLSSSTCKNKDTITVFVVPGFSMVMSPAAPVICKYASVTLGATLDAAYAPYTYSWSPATGLSSTTVANPVASPLVTTTYTLTATSNTGCAQQQTVTVTINGVPPGGIVTPLPATVCLGSSTQLTTTIYPDVCATTTAACSGPVQTITVGTTTSSTTTYSPHYTSATAYSNRKQYLFRKTELDAMGFTGGGKISSIALNYTTAGTSLTGMVIKMGCTTLTEFPNGNHVAGLTTVKTSFTHVPTVGWNTFTLSSPYMWDGMSNLIVEFCVDAAQTGTASSVQYSAPGFYGQIYDNIVTVSGACSDPTGTRTTVRPNMQFTFCQAIPSGLTYSWSPSASLSSSTIQNPVATPAVTTTYTVTITDGLCSGTETVSVNVVPDFTITMSPDPTICLNTSTSLSATPSPAGTYTYSWSPATGLSGTTIANPLASPDVTTTYTVTVTASTGCAKTNTVTVNISGSAPIATAAPVSSIVCLGASTQLNTTIFPDLCTTTAAACTGPVQTITVGTTTSSTTTYSPHYTSATAYSNRKQYLFRKTELDAMGFTGGGKISSIALNYTTAGTSLAGMVIKMGCTTLTEFPDGNHVAGLTTVKTSFTHVPTVGWNTFTLTSPYMWDGASNLIVEFCVDAAQTGTASSIQYSAPGFYGQIYDNIVTVSGACSDPTGTRTTVRPNMQFTFCQAIPSGLSYSWSPSASLSNAAIQNPIATPAATTTYTVSITNGSCVGTTTVVVNVVPDFTTTMSPDPTICLNTSTSLSATPSPAGTYTYSWSPATGLSGTTIANPLASPDVTTTYTVTVTASTGCAKTSTVTVSISGSAPIATAAPVSSIVCLGASTQLNATIFPDLCTTTAAACTGPVQTITVGTTTSSTTTYSPHYTSATAYSNRKQYLFRKTELDAMGFTGGGKISSIALNYTTAGTSLAGMVIKMGCTTLTEFPNGNHVAGLSTVKTSFTHAPTVGWNTFTLTNPYMWDGASNLIVEFCVDAAQTGTASSVQYSAPGFYGQIYDNIVTVSGACSDPTGTRTTVRPNMQFTFCQAIPSGLSYSWSPSASLSNAAIQNPIATPAVTTTYTVSITNGSCVGTTTVVVNVVPDFTMTMSPDVTICLNNSTTLNMTPSPAGTYTYSWSPATALSSTTIVNPVASPDVSTTYTLTATSSSGCVKTNTVNVTVSGISPLLAPVADATTVCPNVSNQLDVLVYPGYCTTTTLACSGPVQTITVGTATTSTTTYSPHYTSATAYSNRKQYLFRKTELDAMGFTGGGKISSIALNYTTAGASLTGMVIKMGCTTLTEFPNGNHVAGLTTVKSSFTHVPTVGWNTFTLSSPYMWDGLSNLIVEFCVDAAQTGTASSVQYSAPGFYGQIYDNIVTVSGACSDPTGTRTTVRPNMRFSFCQAVPPAFTYSWSPPTGLSSATVINPTSTIASATTYTVTVTDGGSCSGTGTLSIDIDSSNYVIATPNPDTMVCAGQTVQLGSSVFGSPVPATLPSCGVNGTVCSMTTYMQQVGTGTFSSISYSPFYGAYADGRRQYLYTAAALNAAGITSGTITSLAWNIITKSSTLPYTDFTISMGCTNATTLTTAGWVAVTQVATIPSYSSVAGWNTFVLDAPFDWDGVSNIVIQTCYNNANGSFSASDAIQYTSPAGYTSMLSNYSNVNGTNGCSMTPVYTATVYPNVRFTVCPPPASTFSYAWSPPASVSNSTIANPTTTPLTATTYTVTVSGGVCTVTDTMNIIMCSILPIELLQFTGKSLGDKNLLEWTTATETNNDYFSLEHSAEGINFESIAIIDGAGNSNSPLNYSRIHEHPLKGMNYYRLKQTDFNGAETFSSIVPLNNSADNTIFRVYPNPASSDLSIDLSTMAGGELKILLYNMYGSLVMEQPVTAKKGMNTFRLDIDDLAQGIYVLKVSMAEKVFSETYRISKN